MSKDQQTIALKQAFGISEIGVQEALHCSFTDSTLKVASREGLPPLPQEPSQAAQVAALSR